jgi:hypothetical protein
MADPYASSAVQRPSANCEVDDPTALSDSGSRRGADRCDAIKAEKGVVPGSLRSRDATGVKRFGRPSLERRFVRRCVAMHILTHRLYWCRFVRNEELGGDTQILDLSEVNSIAAILGMVGPTRAFLQSFR